MVRGEAAGPDRAELILDRLGRALGVGLSRTQTLRYGENSHQAAALYADADAATASPRPTQLGGKEMSYNNYVDADAALRAAYDFAEPAVGRSSSTPIRAASRSATDVAAAHQKAHACDPVSAYGGVIAANRTVTLAMAETVKGIFTEVVVAPGFEPAPSNC